MEETHDRSSIDELFTELGADSQRLIKIFIGDSERPIQFQQSVLESISQYFTSAFRADRFEEGKSGILRLPEDSVEVWKILANWIIHREVPETLLRGNLLLSIRCWTTADKYDIKDFQDAIMLCMLIELISDIEQVLPDAKLDLEMVQTAFESTAEGSPLRGLVVDRKVFEYGYCDDGEGRYETMWEEIRSLDGTGFLPQLVKARKEMEDWDICSFIDCKTGSRQTLWREFMVGALKSKKILISEFETGKGKKQRMQKVLGAPSSEW